MASQWGAEVWSLRMTLGLVLRQLVHRPPGARRAGFQAKGSLIKNLVES